MQNKEQILPSKFLSGARIFRKVAPYLFDMCRYQDLQHVADDHRIPSQHLFQNHVKPHYTYVLVNSFVFVLGTSFALEFEQFHEILTLI